MRGRWLVIVAMAVLTCGSARGQRSILAEDYADRLKGMWAGQLLGNYAGRPVEGTTVSYDGYAITEYPVKWDDLSSATWRRTDGTAQATGYWDGDDDTCFELLYANLLAGGPECSNAQLTALWDSNVRLDGIYIANRQAKFLISSHGVPVPDSGSARFNMHGPSAIDSQITTETLGGLCPGMRGQASALAGQFGAVSNSGYSLHAAQFYSAMYAQAPFAADVEELVDKGLEAVPLSSRTYEIVQAAVGAYQQDLADNGQADAWLAARDSVIGFVNQRGRYRYWVESGMNTGMTVLALLYGAGDARDTIEYAVRGGYDSDCNPATAAGLLGMMKGYDALLTDLALAVAPGTYAYRPNAATSLSGGTWTLDQVTATLQSAGEQQIVHGYGPSAIVGEGAARTYLLGAAGSGPDAIGPLQEHYPPAGPAGLVGQVIAAGGTVQVTSNGSNDPSLDRKDPRTLIDGAIDLGYSGALAYDTYTAATAPRTDWYALSLSQEAVFGKLVFHEGDIRYNGTNNDPRVVEPLGGYFTALNVQVLRDGQWADVEGLTLSEPLDPCAFYQHIELTFTAIEGTDIRVIGPAGGSRPYTSCVELEVFAPAPGDINNDGVVDVGDLGILAYNWDSGEAVWRLGDINNDGLVDVGDLGILAAHWGWVAAAGTSALPEPASLALLLPAMGLLLRRRRKPQSG